MVRWPVIAVVGCLYVAVSAWIVASEGQRYRESLRQVRPPRNQSEKPSNVPLESNHETSIAQTPHDSGTVGESTGAAQTPTGEQPGTQRVPKETPLAQTNVVDKAAPQSPPIAQRALDGKAEAAPAPVDPLAGDPVWNQPRLTKNWDLANLSSADERAMGADLHDVIVQLNPLAADGSWLKRIEDVANPLLEKRQRKDITYKFEILDSPEVNAFSHPGGYVYVTRGLFSLIGEAEDYALQYAIGHEIAHVDLRHAIKCLQDPDFKVINGGTLRKLYWIIIPFGYPTNQDYEADGWVYDRMRGLGRSKRETLAFLNKFAGYAESHGFPNGQAKVRLDTDSSLLDIHYRRQTAAWRRLAHLKERLK